MTTVDYDRMFCYLWWEQAHPGEAKFGERWVPAGQDPEKSILKRVRTSLGVRWHLLDSGEVKLHSYWDVTSLAKKAKRYYKQSRMDDYIRPQIGHRQGTTGEIHTLPPDEIKLKVDRYLASVGQKLPEVGLTQWQATAAENALHAIDKGCRFISAELCARFGKTIWAGTLIRETNMPLTVIATYVKTSFTSFKTDLSGFEQFKNIEIVSTEDDDWQETVKECLKTGKQVVVFLSLCNGSRRQSKIDFLFKQRVRRLLIVDEADFGAHKNRQAIPLIDAMKPTDVSILMTGTNADRAVGAWSIDHQLSVVYPELVMEKRNPRKSYKTSLRYFNVDPSRHALVCDVEFYQMNLMNAVEYCRKIEPDLFVQDGIYLPSWTKFAMNPLKAKGFWSRMLKAVFDGTQGWDDLNIDHQIGSHVKNRVAMMFLPGSITNKNLGIACDLAQEALPNFVVIPVYGEVTTNYECEKDVKEQIETARKENKSVLILSARMAQRSFSVGAITELYLAYDSGENGATIQKISRTLTPDQAGKIGRVISLSFDPNRDDKFDSLLLETAINYKNSRNLQSASQAMAAVLKTVDLFRCTEDGSVKIDKDTYLEQAIARNSITRVTGKVSDLSLLNNQELAALASGSVEAFRQAKMQVAQRGKTGLNRSKTKTGNMTPLLAKLQAKARDVIAGIVENIEYFVYATDSKTPVSALEKIVKSEAMDAAFFNKMGIDASLVLMLFERGVINKDFVELQLYGVK